LRVYFKVSFSQDEYVLEEKISPPAEEQVGLALAIFHFYVPETVKSANLRRLFITTAGAFRCPVPNLHGLSYGQCLREYALFTRDNAEKIIRQGTARQVRAELYDSAELIGQKLRRQLRLKTYPEFARACEITYKAIAIECHVDSGGMVNIPRCYFSSFYTGEVCRIISSLDEGLIAGLSGGLKLEFSERITEGSGYCGAFITQPGSTR
jgi:hypothetical protein